MCETGIGLNLDVSGKRKSKTPKVGWKVELDKVKMDKRLEFKQMVPKFTERPVKVCLCFDSSVLYILIFYDWETTGTGKIAEICQLIAIDQNGNTYSRYILPTRNISAGASRVNKLTVQSMHGKRVLCKDAYLSSLCPLMMLSHLFFNFLAKQPLHPATLQFCLVIAQQHLTFQLFFTALMICSKIDCLK